LADYTCTRSLELQFAVYSLLGI